MGLSPRHVARVQARNVAAAGAVVAVSPTLAAKLTTGHGCATHVVANGCLGSVAGTAQTPPPALESAAPVAGLVGQLNERLDLSMLEAVAATGCAVSIVGPRSDRDSTFGRRLDELLARPNVHWHGAQSATAVQSLLRSWDVGLTPYVDNEFNRASFPLKTLEYLAAGLPCVSTDLPAVAWLATDLVDVASDPRTFAELVQLRLLRTDDEAQRVQRRLFARQHSWDARARQFLDLLPSTTTPWGIPTAAASFPSREAT
jgi:teichuronic acid biosynthesis glycosyltransferase TuaH